MLPADQGSQFCSAVGRQQRANNDSHRAGECLLLARSGRVGETLCPSASTHSQLLLLGGRVNRYPAVQSASSRPDRLKNFPVAGAVEIAGMWSSVDPRLLSLERTQIHARRTTCHMSRTRSLPVQTDLYVD